MPHPDALARRAHGAICENQKLRDLLIEERRRAAANESSLRETWQELRTEAARFESNAALLAASLTYQLVQVSPRQYPRPSCSRIEYFSLRPQSPTFQGRWVSLSLG